MPKPQYNVKQTDTGSRSYNQPAFRPAQTPPKVNPLKNWWNSIVNNARQNAYSPVNTWDTVAPNVPTFNTSTQRTPWDIPYWTPPSVKTPLPKPTYSVFDPFGITQNTGMNMPNTIPTAYGTNTKRGGADATPMPPAGKFGRGQFPQILNFDSWLVASQNPGSSYERETLAELIARGAVDPNSHDPYEIGGSPYQTGVWVANPELPVDNGGGGGGGGSYDYFSKPSSPSYTGYGGSGYFSMPSSPNYTGYSNGYYSMPSSGGYGGGYGSSGYLSMPQAPNYTGYGGSGYASMPSSPTYRGRGSRNQSTAPSRAGYQGGHGSYGGYGGGYVGGQSQRSSWYGALLQWNI